MTWAFVAPNVNAVCTISSGTSANRVDHRGQQVHHGAEEEERHLLRSSMPNHKMSSGMNAVIGRYLIGATMGSKMRLMSSYEPIAMPSGKATASDSPKALAMRSALIAPSRAGLARR